MRTDRPVNINPFRDYKFPFPAIVSIIHRVLGMVLFAGFALALYLLDLSLGSREGFDQAGDVLENLYMKMVVIFFIFSLVYHLIAGIKHLLLDFHVGDTFRAAEIGAGIVVASSFLITGIIGFNLW